MAALEAALEAVGGDDSPLRARLLAALGQELIWAGDRERRARLSDEALVMARRLGEPGTLAQVLLERFLTIAAPSTLGERLENSTELLVLAEHLGDPVTKCRASLLRFRAALEAGEIEEADRHLEAAERPADELGQPTLRWLAGFYRAARVLVAGDLEEAEQLAVAAFELGQASGQQDAIAIFAAQLFGVRLEQGRVGELEARLAETATANPAIPAFRGALAVLYCELDRLEEARVPFDALAARGFADLPVDSTWGVTVGMCAAVCSHLGDVPRAAVLRDLLAPYSDQILVTAVPFYSSAHHLGMLATTLGRFDEAETHFATAASTHERIGAPGSPAPGSNGLGCFSPARRRRPGPGPPRPGPSPPPGNSGWGTSSDAPSLCYRSEQSVQSLGGVMPGWPEPLTGAPFARNLLRQLRRTN